MNDPIVAFRALDQLLANEPRPRAVRGKKRQRDEALRYQAARAQWIANLRTAVDAASNLVDEYPALALEWADRQDGRRLAALIAEVA